MVTTVKEYSTQKMKIQSKNREEEKPTSNSERKESRMPLTRKLRMQRIRQKKMQENKKENLRKRDSKEERASKKKILPKMFKALRNQKSSKYLKTSKKT
jgi:hypothetical protein